MKRASLLALAMAATFFLAQTLSVSGNVHADSDSVRRGAESFAENGCSHCHGQNGIGGGKGPDLKNVGHRLNAAQMTTQIHDGGKSMPPYGDALDEKQIADLVDYLRSKRKAAPAVKASTPTKN